MTKTTAGRDPKDMTAPCNQSESHLPRRHQDVEALAWPWPPARLHDRLRAVCVCSLAAPPNRSWCEHCGEVLP